MSRCVLKVRVKADGKPPPITTPENLVLSGIAWYVVKLTLGVRVSAVEEAEGLDVGEHGMEAYPGFVPTQEARAEVI